MRPYRDTAVVLRRHKLGEADLIVTLLTRNGGLVRAVAKGVRRTRSKFGGKLELFSHVDVQLHPGRSLDIIMQVQSLESLSGAIVADYGAYTTACAIAETAERLAGEERAPAVRLHGLTVGALRAIAEQARPNELILDAYLLRAMGFAGWAPSIGECARCAAPGPHRAFHIAAGGSVCTHCRPSGAATPKIGVLDLMEALHRGDWDGALASVSAVRSETSGLISAYVQWHLERRLKTLPLIDRSTDRGPSSGIGQDVAGESPREPGSGARSA
ncbi:DNA repair protein RecO [Millisia brevis]|uniref:DNA repair protein RecO n=1 Tax=Millisia brevis TaxID=264148 RepID=UPI000A7640E9|nr:DNA repair protein RecO [Millisia brevis]